MERGTACSRVRFRRSRAVELGLALLAAAWVTAAASATASGQAPTTAAGEEIPDPALARLDARLASQPDDLEALAERARLRTAKGMPMGAYLDRLEILRRRPEDAEVARLAAFDLADAGAPQAAVAFLERIPAALSGQAGAALSRRLAGDLAARRVRWGWAEPVFDPAERRHEAEAAIAMLAAMHEQDPRDERAAGDLLLAYRLADRMVDVVALWEQTVRTDAPYWLRNAAADAYLALHRPAEAEALYRSFAAERAGFPEPWLGIYWATIEQRRYADAVAALGQLAKIPGQELTAEVQRGWLLLFQDLTAEGQAHFDALFDRYPGDPRVREGLATAYLWQGQPRRGLQSVEELLARTTLAVPPVDNPGARISRAGALSALGDLAAARCEAAELVALYPENVHAQRLRRDLQTQLSPEVRLEGRYDTSDRGLGEAWSQLEVSVPLATRARLAAGGYASSSDDERFSRGDVREAYLGFSLRPGRWLSLNAEAAWDVGGEDFGRGPATGARMTLLPDDRWRAELGYRRDAWRDLPLRARAAGIVADTFDAGLSYAAGTRWDARLGGGRSELSDGNRRTWGLAAAQVVVRQGPVYRASFGAEAYASENSRSDVAYFSPARDRSASLTHRSEWRTMNAPRRRHSFSLLGHAGVYEQEGFSAGPVGGLWLESDWDLSGRAVLVVGAGARSQLYDGSRELDPRFYLTLRRRF